MFSPLAARRVVADLKNMEGILLFLLGGALSALAAVFPKTLIWLPILAALGIVLWLIARAHVSNRHLPISDWELSLREPKPNALKLVREANSPHLVVGSIVEAIPHPSLATRSELRNLGWAPGEVKIRNLQAAFDCAEVLQSVGGIKNSDPNNGKKYSLANTSMIASDCPALRLDLTETDYLTVTTVQDALSAHPDIGHKFGDLSPAKNRIPHSLCLHYIVRFNNGDLLVLKRKEEIKWYPGTWSISGEEQLKTDDFGRDNLEWLFKRAFCEEVLPLSDDSQTNLDERWQIASKVVQTMRLWSVILESELFNFSLVGLFQLKEDYEGFVEFYHSILNKGAGLQDKEGRMYLLKRDYLLPLLMNEPRDVYPLFDASGTPMLLKPSEFHPSSRYRLFRLVRNIYRVPLEQLVSSEKLIGATN